jgi:hypothetical protein
MAGSIDEMANADQHLATVRRERRRTKADAMSALVQPSAG